MVVNWQRGAAMLEAYEERRRDIEQLRDSTLLLGSCESVNVFQSQLRGLCVCSFVAAPRTQPAATSEAGRDNNQFSNHGAGHVQTKTTTSKMTACCRRTTATLFVHTSLAKGGGGS